MEEHKDYLAEPGLTAKKNYEDAKTTREGLEKSLRDRTQKYYELD